MSSTMTGPISRFFGLVRNVFIWSLFAGTLVGVGLMVFLVWNLLLWPTSVNEALFRYRLSAAAERKASEIRLAGIAPFAWEEVCMNGAYAGDWRYEKYRRVYEDKTHSEGQETWVFIQADGRPTYFMYYWGMAGIEVSHTGSGCWSRSDAVMTRTDAAQARYTMAQPHS